MRRLFLLLSLSVAAVNAVGQEMRYVTDILQLGLFATEDASGDPIRNLVSGTEVTVIERIPNFALVRTAGGDEGWVKSAFLVAEKPARLIVAEAEAEQEQLEQELEEALLARAADSVEVERIVADAASVLATAESDRDALIRLQQENAALANQVEHYRGAVPWPWVIGALLVALGAGALAGYWWLDASIRRRHGGFRVH